ncbi:DUF5791 family protein [Salinibaculum rarum]|uniref:DUF5791 family protein n=1 Tax=Salinibaculum rarum TaxID=3058903 RepID=UPI00265F64D4|nr:DUF5791 family protein [Salinibaculum sp. KK48]
MIRGAFETAGELDPTELRAAYDEALADAIESVGVSAAAEQTNLDESTLRAVVDGETPDLSLDAAATIFALDDDHPDADVLVAEARDILLMGMSAAVLDVEAIAAGIDDELEPKEIQQKIEGRYSMTLDEYALLHAFIENRKR